MPHTARAKLMRALVARVLDLRAEFEAQLRAVIHLEEQLLRTRADKPEGWRGLDEALQRELDEMLRNNTNIRDVLNELAADVERHRASSIGSK